VHPVKSLNSGILLTFKLPSNQKYSLWKQGIQRFLIFHDVSKIYASTTGFTHKHEIWRDMKFPILENLSLTRVQLEEEG
jgi:hypothetical protein